MSAETIAKWIAAVVVLIVFYRKVIKPFICKALALSPEEPIEEKKRITFDEEELEPIDNSEKLLKRAKRSLQLGEADRIEQFKYDALREKLRKITEDSPQASSNTIDALINDRNRR
jgi:flagellar biosynthesis/type III secretory pathway M-ring protein FliF/YscJ